MTKFLIRLGINAVAMYAAIRLVPGIQMQSTSWVAIVVLALIFGLVNTLIAPILKVAHVPVHPHHAGVVHPVDQHVPLLADRGDWPVVRLGV